MASHAVNWRQIYLSGATDEKSKAEGYDPCWPFAFTHLDRAAMDIPGNQATQWRCMHKCVAAARVYARLKKLGGVVSKAVERDQLAEISAFTNALRESLHNLSPGASSALIAAQQVSLRDEIAAARADGWLTQPNLLTAQDEALRALRLLGDVQRVALAEVEKTPSIGRPRTNAPEHYLIETISRAFETETGSRSGFWNFFPAFVRPLHDFGLAPALTSPDDEEMKGRWKELNRARGSPKGVGKVG